MISMDGLTTLYLMLPTSLIINLEQPRLRLSDDQAWQQIVRIAGVSNSSEFQKLDRETQWQVFIQLKELGACIPPPVSYLSPDIFGYCTAFSNFR